MGQTSSQIDRLPHTPPAVHGAPSPSPAASVSVHTTAGRALARELEEPIYASAKPSGKARPSSGGAPSPRRKPTTTPPWERQRTADRVYTVPVGDPPPTRRLAPGGNESEPHPTVPARLVPSSGTELGTELGSSPATGRRPGQLKPASQPQSSPPNMAMAEVAIAKQPKSRRTKVAPVPEPELEAAAGDGPKRRMRKDSPPSLKRKRDVAPEPQAQRKQSPVHSEAGLDEAEPAVLASRRMVDEKLLEPKLVGRTLTEEELKLEILPEEQSLGDAEREEVERIKARNTLRMHIQGWEDEDLVQAGKAKWKNGKDGKRYLKFAQAGHRFKRPKLTDHQEHVQDLTKLAREKRIEATKSALLGSLAKEELVRTASILPPPDSGQEAAPAKDGRREQQDQGEPVNRSSQEPVNRSSQEPVNRSSQEPVNRSSQEPVNRSSQEHVSDWEMPVPPAQPEPQAAMSKKRKRKSALQGDDDEDIQPDGSSVAPESANSTSNATKAARKAARKKHKERKEIQERPDDRTEDGDDHEPPKPTKRVEAKTEPANEDTSSNISTSATTKGAFSAAEKQLADRIFADAMRKERLTRCELVAQIQDWKKCGTFKINLLEAFPNRTRDSVRKFAERRFHGMERGSWTTEQDESLRAAHASHPGQWSHISELVGRTGADCRDRWRLHLAQENAVTGPWCVDEEQELLDAVEECIETLKCKFQDKKFADKDENRGGLEALINWTTVAQKLHGRRTGKRCKEKYGRLKARRAKDENARNGVRVGSSTRAKQKETEKEERKDKKQDERMRAARKTVSQCFEIGDYYDALVEIHSSFKDHAQKFHDEQNVLWSIVSSRNMHSRFALFPAPAALRRAAFETAMEQWSESAPKLKEKLDNAPTVPAKALVLTAWLETKYGSKLKRMTRTYRPGLVGASQEEMEKAKADIKQARVRRGQAGQCISQEVVSESESDDDDDDEHVTDPAESMGRAATPSDMEGEEESTAEGDDESTPEEDEESAREEDEESRPEEDEEGSTPETGEEEGAPGEDEESTREEDEESTREEDEESTREEDEESTREKDEGESTREFPEAQE